jgi:hypothetical protein
MTLVFDRNHWNFLRGTISVCYNSWRLNVTPAIKRQASEGLLPVGIRSAFPLWCYHFLSRSDYTECVSSARPTIIGEILRNRLSTPETDALMLEASKYLRMVWQCYVHVDPVYLMLARCFKVWWGSGKHRIHECLQFLTTVEFSFTNLIMTIRVQRGLCA